MFYNFKMSLESLSHFVPTTTEKTQGRQPYLYFEAKEQAHRQTAGLGNAFGRAGPGVHILGPQGVPSTGFMPHGKAFTSMHLQRNHNRGFQTHIK